MAFQFLFDPRETLPGSIGGNPGSSNPGASLMPYFIASNETFQIPLYKQGLFTVQIDIEGVLDVDGDLVEVT